MAVVHEETIPVWAVRRVVRNKRKEKRMDRTPTANTPGEEERMARRPGMHTPDEAVHQSRLAVRDLRAWAGLVWARDRPGNAVDWSSPVGMTPAAAM